MAGRRGAAAGGQERPAGAHARQPPRRTTSAGPRRGSSRRCSRRGRSPATSELGQALRRRGPAAGVGRRRAGRTSSRTCRRCGAGSSSTCPPGEAARQLKLGPGGLRDVEFSVQLLQLVHGRADESLRSAHHARGARGAGQRWLRRPRRRRGARRVLPAAARRWSTASSCTGCGAPTSCPPTRPTCAGWAARSGTGATRPARCVAQWQAQAREVRRHPRAAVLPAAADRRRPADHVRGAADPGGRARAARGARLPRPGRARCGTSRR